MKLLEIGDYCLDMECVHGICWPGTVCIAVTVKADSLTMPELGKMGGYKEKWIEFPTKEDAKTAYEKALAEWKEYLATEKPTDTGAKESLSEAIYTALKRLGWSVTHFGLSYELGKAIREWDDLQPYGRKVFDAIKEGCAEGIKTKSGRD